METNRLFSFTMLSFFNCIADFNKIITINYYYYDYINTTELIVTKLRSIEI